MKKHYITTPIYYVNDLPHIGHAYTTVAADALARWRRLCGDDVFFLTGTDEHGRKIEQAAARAGRTPLELADEVVERFHSLWGLLRIENDDFIRTTEERHKRCAQKLFSAAFENGDIYPGEYEGWYDVREESFITATRLDEINKLPPEKRPVLEKIKEECFFFRLSAYRDRLLEHYEKNPGFVMPKERMNEVRSFVESGLKDLSISRTTFSWGIAVPGHPRHIMYVWFDALSNYLTAAGYESDPERFAKTWPASLHLVGKDILRFHAVYWPAFLMSAGLAPPERVFAHGWWTVEGEKMSKSLGNVVSPPEIADEFGVDAFRYFLMREIPFGSDGDFSRKALAARINSDLANGLGNFASRALGMVERYFDGAIPEPGEALAEDAPLRRQAGEMTRDFSAAMDGVAPGKALASLWKLIGEADRFVEETKPWEMHKKGEKEKLSRVLWTLCEILRIVALHSHPFMPAAAGRLWEKLGFENTIGRSGGKETSFEWGALGSGARVKKGDNLFSRVNEI